MEFRIFTKEDHSATLEKWEAEATAADLFPNEVQERLCWIDNALQASSKAREFSKTLPYGVFQPGNNIAVATCELVLTDKGAAGGRWLKMLRVVLSPEVTFAVEQEDVTGIQVAVNAYKAAVLGSFVERLTHDADTLKLYGRSDGHLKFLSLLMATITQTESKLSARKEGRWIVIKAT